MTDEKDMKQSFRVSFSDLYDLNENENIENKQISQRIQDQTEHQRILKALM
jgi:hypothetical protein